ncbi:MAG: hypothetical protein KJ955_00260 [Nanoarchaeota archaeon]|nr:hypothetical protein [Nanoarchaeota archaeon]
MSKGKNIEGLTKTENPEQKFDAELGFASLVHRCVSRKQVIGKKDLPSLIKAVEIFEAKELAFPAAEISAYAADITKDPALYEKAIANFECAPGGESVNACIIARLKKKQAKAIEKLKPKPKFSGKALAERILISLEEKVKKQNINNMHGVLFMGEADKGGDRIHPCVLLAKNASAAIAYALIGNTERASEMLKGIEEHIGKVKFGRLYYNNSESNALLTKDSALVAALYSTLGNKDEALAILKDIDKWIGKKNSLYCSGTNTAYCQIISPEAITTGANAAMALAFASVGNRQRAGELLEGIELKIGRQRGLYRYRAEKSKFNSGGVSDTSMVAAAYAATGNSDMAAGIAETLRLKKHKDTFVAVTYALLDKTRRKWQEY